MCVCVCVISLSLSLPLPLFISHLSLSFYLSLQLSVTLILVISHCMGAYTHKQRDRYIFREMLMLQLSHSLSLSFEQFGLFENPIHRNPTLPLSLSSLLPISSFADTHTLLYVCLTVSHTHTHRCVSLCVSMCVCECVYLGHAHTHTHRVMCAAAEIAQQRDILPSSKLLSLSPSLSLSLCLSHTQRDMHNRRTRRRERDTCVSTNFESVHTQSVCC